MRILRYLTKDILIHMVAVSFVLLVIIVSGRFVKYLAEAAVGDLAADVLLPVMLYRLPGFLELIIPLGLFLGILMSYGRLYAQSEMVVLAATGVGPSRLAGYTLVSAVIVMLLVAILSLVVTPLGAARSEALLNDPSSSQGLQSLVAGRFQTRKASKLVSYAQSIDPQSGVMQSVFLSQKSSEEGDQPRMLVTVAREGEVLFDRSTGARYLELRQGYRYVGMPGQLDYEVVSFERFGELIPEPEGGVRTAAPVDGRSTIQLLKSAAAEDRAALYWRLSLPLMVPVVAILALCLSNTNHRRGRYVMMAPAFFIYLAYLMLLASARSAVEEGLDWATLRFAQTHILFFSFALALLYGSVLRAWWLRIGQSRVSA
ncbi:MAG: LPS export ABC transporter permease LptF [Halioglobus sp.]